MNWPSYDGLLVLWMVVLTIIVLGIALGRNCDRQNSASCDELFEEFVLFETLSFTTKLKHLKIVLWLVNSCKTFSLRKILHLSSSVHLFFGGGVGEILVSTFFL